MTDSGVPSEVEAKLLIPREADLRAMARLERIGRYRIRPRATARLHSIYLDTPRFTLAQHRVALRLRRHAGHWEATIKWAGDVRGDIHDRPELTVPLSHSPRTPFVLPPGPLAVHLVALVAGRRLAPILVSDITRRRLNILPATGGPGVKPLAELALDRVLLRAPAARQAALTYLEAEIELLHGTRREIGAIARMLRQRFALQPSAESKFVRGVSMLYGAKAQPVDSVSALPTDTLEQTIRKIISLHLRRMRQYDPGTRLGTDPEALHDMRVACRRLRAAVRALESSIPKPLRRSLRNELGWLGQLLGSVRDLDVQLMLLERYRRAVPTDPGGGLAGLRRYMGSEREQRRADMLAGLDSERYFRLLLRLEDFALGRTRQRAAAAAPQSVAAVGRTAIRKAFRHIEKRGRAIDAAPTDEQLHALRIRTKRLRYLLEFLREVAGKPGRRLVKDLVRLQDLLGSHHDAVVAAEFIRRYVEGPGAQASNEAFLSLGAFLGEERRLAEVARGDFQKAWARFSRRRTLNDLDAVLHHLRLKRAAASDAEGTEAR